jgi:hypothetical protein
MNKIEEMSGKFSAITDDMCNVKLEADIVINTSFEHINQDQYNSWLEIISDHSLIVLQSNNYSIPEHIRISETLDEFIKQSQLTKIFFSGEIGLQLYKRFMIIGKK